MANIETKKSITEKDSCTSNEWTLEEIEKLKKMAKTKHYTVIAEKLGKSDIAVYQKARRLGITLIQDRRAWTKEEENVLKEKWGTCTIEKLARDMRRTPESLKIKASKMNLGAMILNNTEIIVIPEICKIFSISEYMARVAWPQKGLKIIEVSISENKSYQGVYVDELMNFLEQNQDIWDSKKLEENILGIEPAWLKQKRERDKNTSYEEHSVWTEEEKAKARFFIKKGKTYDYIAEKTNHTVSEVTNFLYREGYSYLLPQFWKTKDIKFVRENMKDMSIKEMAQKLGRTLQAVERMKRILEFEVVADEEHIWLPEEDEYLKKQCNRLPLYELANYLQVSKNILIERLEFLAGGPYDSRFHLWFPEEDEYILKNYKNKSINKIAKHLGVSIDTLSAHYKILGIYEARIHEWTEEENAYLKQHYPEESMISLSNYFNVEERVLRKHLKDLGIYKDCRYHDFTEEDDNYLKENYGKESMKSIQEHFGVSPFTLLNHLKDIGLYKDTRFHDWTEEENQFLRENYNKMSKTALAKELHVSKPTLYKQLEYLELDEKSLEAVRIIEERKQLLNILKELLELRKVESENLDIIKK